MYENIFFQLADRDLLVLMLDNPTKSTSASSSSSSFSFKGKCKMGVMWGQVDLNGYSIRSSINNDQPPTSIRFFEMFSPESNSFLTIRNGSPQSKKRKATDSNESLQEINNRDYKQVLVEQMKGLLNSDISDEVQAKFFEFLLSSHFNPKTSSLVAITPLKSHLCSYMSYFPNFQMVYNSFKPLQHNTNVSSSSTTNSNEMFAKLAKFGLYQVVNSSLVFNQTDEFVKVVDDILNGGEASDVGK